MENPLAFMLQKNPASLLARVGEDAPGLGFRLGPPIHNEIGDAMIAFEVVSVFRQHAHAFASHIQRVVDRNIIVAAKF